MRRPCADLGGTERLCEVDHDRCRGTFIRHQRARIVCQVMYERFPGDESPQ